MANILFDRRHLKEYALWGVGAGLAYAIPVLIYLIIGSYYYSAILFIGCILFMFMVLMYTLKLTKRRPEYKSTWSMIIAGHMTILIGIITSVLLSTLFCFLFIPDFMAGEKESTFLAKAPEGINNYNASITMLIAMTATLVNFGVGGVINIVAAYSVKANQMTDKAPSILQGHAKHT